MLILTFYLPRSWNVGHQTMFNWEGGQGQKLETTRQAPFGATSKFMACLEDGGNNEWLLFLQTGTQVPSGKNCTETELAESNIPQPPLLPP